MSSAQDPRRQLRLSRLHSVFSWQFFDDGMLESLTPEGKEQFAQGEAIIQHLPELDATILKYASKHGIDQFNKMDLAILRQALYELLYTETPPAVVIDEAVEISKEYGSEETPSFVHGVLGNVVDDMRKEPQHD